MTNKKKYYKLDNVGIVGSQKKKSAAVKKYHAYKTSEAFSIVKEPEQPYGRKQLKNV